MKKEKNERIKVILTGGHAGATAYALVEKILSRKKKWDIYFIGSRSATEGRFIPTLESKSLPSLGVKYYSIISGRLQRKFSFWTIPSIFKIPISFLHAALILLKIRPSLILSFGGYVSFPVVVMGFLFRIPIIIHEQTSSVGRANRLSSLFADKIAISRPTSSNYFPKNKIVLTGNPILKEISIIKGREKLGIPPTIFITGGSRGSEVINNNVLGFLRDFLTKYKVIHQTGARNLKKFLDFKNNLDTELQKNYQVFDIIVSSDWPKFLQEADVLVSRSGANICSEILVAKIPCVLIPLHFTYMNEQQKNADYIEKVGLAKIIKHDTLSPQTLKKAIEERINSWYLVKEKTSQLKSPDAKAADKLIDLIENALEKRNS